MQTGDKRGSEYQSFMLRLWRDTGQPAWRASLQSTATERMYHFETVDALYVFIITQLSHQEWEIRHVEDQPNK